MKKGFTLIELLIVIAIIGILAGVILVSTSSARTKAQIAAGKQTIKSAMSMATGCSVGGGTVAPPALASGTGNICNADATFGTWPTAPTGCTYTTTAALYPATPTMVCGTTTITCTTDTGQCI